MKNIFIKIIILYRKFISPLFGKCCRFYPSCSEYAILALKKHGLFKGLFLSIKRVVKCNPFHPGGYDPL